MQKLEYYICLLLVIMFSSSVFAADKVVVIPLFDSATGNATPSDVVAGKTFSNARATGLTGTLELPPTMQTDTNTYGMKFNLIPAGTFTMGSPDGSGTTPEEPGRYSDEIQHEVTLSRSFYMQCTEVTQQQWREVVLAAEDAGYLTVDALAENPSNYDTCGHQCPVERVSWDDIQAWIAALNQLESRSGCNTTPNNCYRLPTEAQWEYAARAGSTTAFANGAITVTKAKLDPNLDAMGWYSINNVVYNFLGDSIGYPNGSKPVARKQANAWGLYDMHGNVWEWCQDWFGVYDSGPVTDPQGPDVGDDRVVRSGGYSMSAGDSRSAIRYWEHPGARWEDTGFRLARSVALDP